MLKINECQLASLRHEGKNPSITGLQITSDFIKGDITSKEAINKIKAFYLGGANIV